MSHLQRRYTMFVPRYLRVPRMMLPVPGSRSLAQPTLPRTGVSWATARYLASHCTSSCAHIFASLKSWRPFVFFVFLLSKILILDACILDCLDRHNSGRLEYDMPDQMVICCVDTSDVWVSLSNRRCLTSLSRRSIFRLQFSTEKWFGVEDRHT